MIVYGVYWTYEFFNPTCKDHSDLSCHDIDLMHVCKTMELANSYVDKWAAGIRGECNIDDKSYRGIHNAIAYYNNCPCGFFKSIEKADPISEQEYLKIDMENEPHGYVMYFVEELELEE